MLLSGPSGTGKSLIIHAVKQIVELCESQDKTFGSSLSTAGTEDRRSGRLPVSEKLLPRTSVSILAFPKPASQRIQKLERLYELMREYYDGSSSSSMRSICLEGPYQEAEYNSSHLPSFTGSQTRRL